MLGNETCANEAMGVMEVVEARKSKAETVRSVDAPRTVDASARTVRSIKGFSLRF